MNDDVVALWEPGKQYETPWGNMASLISIYTALMIMELFKLSHYCNFVCVLSCDSK